MKTNIIVKLLKWVVNLEIVPKGWLTKLAGLGAVVTGGMALLGVGGVDMGTEAATALFLGGLTSIGWKRAQD